ncbi:roadblock/LC7 domain-containing protein [Kitasatospora sp. NPDC059327]|uniref:roadblock/LC7 domain-containing protein n=1 Tax=Kitasatospora sp. NPDC059327 TaxID=3346803 RepID=UPI00369515CD
MTSTHPNPAPSTDWMLQNVVALAGVRHAVVASDDGLLKACAGAISRDDADRLAASVCGILSTARALAPFCGDDTNALRQCVQEFDQGMIFIAAAGENTLLAVATDALVDAALVAHRMTDLSARLSAQLSTGLRTAGPEGGVRP